MGRWTDVEGALRDVLAHQGRRRTGIAILASLVLLAACEGGEWVDRRSAYAFWADDGTAALVIIRRYEERPTPRPFNSSDVQIRNRPYQLLEVDPNTGERSWVFSEEHDQLRRPYFMRSAGYVYYEMVRGGALERVLRWRERGRVTMGAIEGLPITVPSPSGAMLCEVTDCEASAETCRVSVTFREAESLETVGEAELEYDRPHIPLRVVWISSDEVVVGDLRANVGFGVTVAGAVRAGLPAPSCFEPATTSSPWDDEGRRLVVEFDEDRPHLVVTEGDGAGYPDRCWPYGT